MKTFCPTCYGNLEKEDRFLVSETFDDPSFAYTLTCKKQHSTITALELNNQVIYYQCESSQNEKKYLLVGVNKLYDEPQAVILYQKLTKASLLPKLIVIYEMPKFISIDLSIPLPSQISYIVNRLLTLTTYT